TRPRVACPPPPRVSGPPPPTRRGGSVSQLFSLLSAAGPGRGDHGADGAARRRAAPGPGLPPVRAVSRRHRRKVLLHRGARVAEADRLHRPEAQALRAGRGDHLDRLAALEVGRAGFPLLEFGLVAGQQARDEGLVLLLVERAVDVVGAAAARAHLVVARLL